MKNTFKKKNMERSHTCWASVSSGKSSTTTPGPNAACLRPLNANANTSRWRLVPNMPQGAGGGGVTMGIGEGRGEGGHTHTKNCRHDHVSADASYANKAHSYLGWSSRRLVHVTTMCFKEVQRSE